MAYWEPRRWESRLDAPARKDRRDGDYSVYIPDRLQDRPIVLRSGLSTKASEVENAVRRLTVGPEAGSLEGLARFLLRSEAIASSRIEGLKVSAAQVAMAELASSERINQGNFTDSARLVANNITILREAASDLATASVVSVEGIDALHRSLLREENLQGLRRKQNWIGGSDYHPLDAEFVPPPWEMVEDLMRDLADYASGGLHAPLVQAALVHAQFETIHPYADGNGRVGRALLHTVLTRRGLTPSAILPISLVLLTRSDEYIAALTAYRYAAEPGSAEANRAQEQWIELFFDATLTAVEQASQFASELVEMRSSWHDRLANSREASGKRGRPRSDSAVARLIDLMPEMPLATTRTVESVLGVSFPQARDALEALAGAGVLTRRQVERGTTGYLAMEVFDLLTLTERQLASTRWDTRDSPPSRDVPDAPPSRI